MTELYEEEDLKKAVETLREGGVILYPSDTVWGIGADATNNRAVEKIFEIKKRAAHKSCIVLVSTSKQLLHHIANPLPHLHEILDTFTTPTTIVYPNGINLASKLIATDGSVAIRLVKNKFVNAMINRLKKPIVSTSANISGQEAARFFKEIDSSIIQQVDYCVRFKQNDTTAHEVSTIYKINEDGKLEKLR
ncbi:MAG: L-threonylcarbamoyladenylate synthase [Chitinophagaceae bacterium]